MVDIQRVVENRTKTVTVRMPRISSHFPDEWHPRTLFYEQDVDVEAINNSHTPTRRGSFMVSFMGRAGATGASAAVVRALSPLRIGGAVTNRRSSPKSNGSSKRPDVSMARLRALQGELATILDDAGEGSRDEKASRKTGAKEEEARLIEIVRAIAELVSVL